MSGYSRDQLLLAARMIQAINGILLALKGFDEQALYFVNPPEGAWNEELSKWIFQAHEFGERLAKITLAEPERLKNQDTQGWIISKFRGWAGAKCGVYELGRVSEVEEKLGPLGLRRWITVPSYAHVILQGYVGAGIRHPEYHLARDLVLATSLYQDSQALSTDDLSLSDEPNQSLGRSVVVTCFNLLEAFTSGLSAEFLFTTPQASESIRKSLLDDRMPLRKRFMTFPGLVRPDGSPMIETAAIKQLFEDIKPRRDTYVHCSAGEMLSKQGHVKDRIFHEIDPAFVNSAIDMTLDAIATAWQHAHNTHVLPSWLPSRDEQGRINHNEVHLERNSTP